MALVTCVTGTVQWTGTLKVVGGTPILTVTMGEEKEIPQVFKDIDLFELFGDELDHHPTDDV